MPNENNYLDPAEFGLGSRVVIKKISSREIAIIKDRKSRIIMKDGEKILNEVHAIREIYPKKKVFVQTNAPVCSKTTNFLSEHGVKITGIS